ncbi:winged helix DNA-binding domain-containing protein [Paenibacillus sp. TH7-28]
MANKEIAYRRLRNQRIAWLKEKTPSEVTRRLGALQAQDYTQALWAIGLRMQNASAGEIEQAIADKHIILTWAMRGTLHFVPAEDLNWMLKLLTPRILAKDKRRLEQLELDPKRITQSEKIIYSALKEKRWLSRPDLMKLLEDAGIDTKQQRGYHLLWYLAQTGLICLGPVEGKQQTFVLLEDWVYRHNKLSAEESLRELARRFFTGHGPATLHDFAWWSGLTITEARNGLESVQKTLYSEKIEGVDYWMGPDDAQVNVEDSIICLLPGYDEYLLGYKDRSAVLDPDYAPLIVPGNNGVFMPMLVVNGEVAGTWKRTVKKSGIDIVIRPFTALGSRKERVIEAARRYGEFVHLPVSQVIIEENGTKGGYL